MPRTAYVPVATGRRRMTPFETTVGGACLLAFILVLAADVFTWIGLDELSPDGQWYSLSMATIEAEGLTRRATPVCLAVLGCLAVLAVALLVSLRRMRRREAIVSPESAADLRIAMLLMDCLAVVSPTRLILDLGAANDRLARMRPPANQRGAFQLLVDTGNYLLVRWALVLVALAAVTVLAFVWAARAKRGFDDAQGLLRGRVESMGGLPAQAFLDARRDLRAQGDFTGIYVLRNATKDKSYVGQSKHVLERVRQHLTGNGNGDVYADLKAGDTITVYVESLADSGYASLDDLERDAIEAYHGYDRGYNKTRGNDG